MKHYNDIIIKWIQNTIITSNHIQMKYSNMVIEKRLGQYAKI